MAGREEYIERGNEKGGRREAKRQTVKEDRGSGDRKEAAVVERGGRDIE